MTANKNNNEKDDYTSAVPKYKFADTLEKQKEQLQNNPLLKRFKKSREKFSTDPHRPHYHFVSPESTMNDPNGLCFFN